MNFIFNVILLIAAVVLLDAAPQKSMNSKQNNHSTKGNGKNSPMHREWVNISIKIEPDMKVPVGGILELECEAIGSPPPRIKWYHQKNGLLESSFPDHNEIVNTAIGKVKSRMIIDCVTPYYQGDYFCVGTSASKKKSSESVSVMVQEKAGASDVPCDKNKLTAPRIITWGPTLLEFADRDIVLPCKAIGNPTPTIHWINQNEDIVDSKNVNPHYKILPNGDLFISRISWDDMGMYICVAQNSLGEDRSETFVYPVKKDD